MNKTTQPNANWKFLLKPSVSVFSPSDPYACILAKEGCSAIRQCANLENALHSLLVQ